MTDRYRKFREGMKDKDDGDGQEGLSNGTPKVRTIGQRCQHVR